MKCVYLMALVMLSSMDHHLCWFELDFCRFGQNLIPSL